MNKIDPNAPAFPTEVIHLDGGEIKPMQTSAYSSIQPGLSIRAELAARAMQGLVMQQAPIDRIINENSHNLAKQIAQASVIIADALIAELNREG